VPLEHDPEKACPALDAGWIPVFGKRDGDSKKSHHALAAPCRFASRLVYSTAAINSISTIASG
jgi:hypothetical protein